MGSVGGQLVPIPYYRSKTAPATAVRHINHGGGDPENSAENTDDHSPYQRDCSMPSLPQVTALMKQMNYVNSLPLVGAFDRAEGVLHGRMVSRKHRSRDTSSGVGLGQTVAPTEPRRNGGEACPFPLS
jgi:hypothetical protein